MWIGGWCTVCLACLYQPFMVLWVGQDMMFDYSVVILFCLYFYILKMGDIRALYSDAAGLWWANRKRAIWESVANLVLNILFVQIWGVHGVIVATIFSLLVINFGFGSQIVFKEYFKNNKLGEYFGLHAQYALVTIMVTVVTYGICRYIILEGLIGLICKGILCVFVPNIIYFACYRKTKVYKEAIPWLLTILKRR